MDHKNIVLTQFYWITKYQLLRWFFWQD